MRHLCSILVFVGACGLLYFGWSYHRVSGHVLVTDRGWPRPFPYPDGWLFALNNWYDARYPAPPGTIKLRGELKRVRLTTLGACAVAGVAFASGAAPIALRQLRRLWRGRGFDLLPTSGGGSGDR